VLFRTIVEEAKDGGRMMVLVGAAAEAGVRDEAAQGLARGGGAEDAGWFVGREADQSLFDELDRERRRRVAGLRRRCHGGLGGSVCQKRWSDWLNHFKY
jgi:hypothetical protein